MRIIFIAFCVSISLYATAQDFFENSNDFFSKYIIDGKVKYSLIKEEPEMLYELVDEIATHDLKNKRISSDYLKAFYINAYNILVINQVVENYPAYGPLKIDGFFDGKKNTVMGKELTLNELEKQTLYKQYPDPRLHFVLVCAAKGCPPIANYAFKPEKLETQIEERTKYVLNLDWFIQTEKRGIKISKIFEWYEMDFKSNDRSIIDYLNDFRGEKISKNEKVGYYEYDWSLNE